MTVNDELTLRLLWPQSPGAGTSRVRELAPKLTVAEFIPRRVMHLQRLLTGFSLLGGG